MPRFANGVVTLSLFGAIVAVGAIGTAPLYLPRLSGAAQSADQPQTAAGQLQALALRLDRLAEQIERIEKAQQHQDKAIASLRAQEERTSDRVAATTRQMLDLAEYATRKGPITRQEFDELKQAMALSRQQLESIRAGFLGTPRRTAQKQ